MSVLKPSIGFEKFFTDFSHFIFPINCIGCGDAMNGEQNHLCKTCENGLPLTKYWMHNSSPVAHIFFGKIQLETATSFLFFQKGNITQRLIHALKYSARTEIGVVLGQKFGEALKNSSLAEVDVIIPIPLHVSRLKKRGYNQCDFVAQGLSEALKIPVESQAIIRHRYNESQTQKGTYDRWANVKSLFQVALPEAVQNKHVLLIDDVVTTGSTLEACAAAILAISGAKVSIATLACPAPY